MTCLKNCLSTNDRRQHLKCHQGFDNTYSVSGGVLSLHQVETLWSADLLIDDLGSTVFCQASGKCVFDVRGGLVRVGWSVASDISNDERSSRPPNGLRGRLSAYTEHVCWFEIQIDGFFGVALMWRCGKSPEHGNARRLRHWVISELLISSFHGRNLLPLPRRFHHQFIRERKKRLAETLE